MSFYNLLFGMNPHKDIILAILGLKESDIERFRDCGFYGDDSIYIYTRTGGNNRNDYPNEKLTNNPYYLNDSDDEFDNTYATYCFRIPSGIEKDVNDFRHMRENGISGKFIQWILKTLEREETEQDKYHRLYWTQNNLVLNAKRINICETNGWVVTPLDDSSCEKLLSLMEEAGGKSLSYVVRPYKLIVEQNLPCWDCLDKDKSDIEKEMCYIHIKFPREWEVDSKLWERWQAKFGERYPKAINTIKESIERMVK